MPQTYFLPSYLRNSAYAADCEAALIRSGQISSPLPALLSKNKDVPQVLKITGDQHEVVFVGPAKNSDSDAASVRADHPIPASCGLYYFECTILSKGRDGFIGIGFCRANVLLSRLPGWEADSWGYHGDDGHSFCSQGTGKDYGPKFTTGDIVGCAINFATGECFYTKNGVHLGVAFTGIGGSLYPSIGLRTLNEHVRVNFGQEPFVFDIDFYYRQEKTRMYARVGEAVDDVSHKVRELVSGYLAHNGFTESARALAVDVATQTDTAVDYPAVDTDAGTRQQVRSLIGCGDVDAALELLEGRWSGMLHQPESELLFQLRCQKFLEMVKRAAAVSGQLDQAIEYGQSLQNIYSDPSHKVALQETFSVLAYDDPLESPLGHLLSDDGRARLAEHVNEAVLVYSGRSARSDLEDVVAGLARGVQVNEPGMAFINVHRDFLTEIS